MRAMSDAKSPQDLSMEEILATIRRIIAEDEQLGGTARRGAEAGISSGATVNGRGESGPRGATQSSGEAAGATDILDLTDALNEDGSVQRLAPRGGVSRALEPAHAPPSVEMTPVEPNSAEPTKAEAKPAEANPRSDRPKPTEVTANSGSAVDPARPPSSAQSAGGLGERFVSDVAALAAATAFGRLASVPRVRREPPLVAGRPLDDIVCELLRPLLQTWLDENLPGIVERLVRAEIARISARSEPS
jgi:cell pole-organizing protein PopZ